MTDDELLDFWNEHLWGMRVEFVPVDDLHSGRSSRSAIRRGRRGGGRSRGDGVELSVVPPKKRCFSGDHCRLGDVVPRGESRS